jgi:hypothetical protein
MRRSHRLKDQFVELRCNSRRNKHLEGALHFISAPYKRRSRFLSKGDRVFNTGELPNQWMERLELGEPIDREGYDSLWMLGLALRDPTYKMGDRTHCGCWVLRCVTQPTRLAIALHYKL